MLDIMRGILEQGFIYAIMALGVYISYSILDFPDLSVDGSFPLGAAVTAVLILSGVDPWLACLIAFLCGILAGLVTGVIHVKLGVTDLLSGIIMMTALYSVNLRIAKSPNVALFGERTILNSGVAMVLGEGYRTSFVLALLFVLALAMKLVLDWYLSTRSGMLLRAAGDNAQQVTLLAKHPGHVKILGLAISNGFVALSGSVMCQYQRYFDVSMGGGMIVMGLASVIIGINVFGKARWMKATTMVLLGSALYKGCVSLAMQLGFEPSDMKLIIAVLFLGTLMLNNALGRKRRVDHADAAARRQDL